MKPVLTDFYERLPHWFRSAAVAMQGARQARQRYGETYFTTLASLRETEYLPPDELEPLQREQLKKLLDEAVRGTSYYSVGVGALPRAAVEHAADTLDLTGLPLLSKRTLKERTPEFHNQLRSTLLTSSTSGSTGAPLQVALDRVSLQQRLAFMHRHREWLGTAARARSVRFSGNRVVPSRRMRPPYAVHNPAEHQLLVSTYHLSGEALAWIGAAIERYEPEILDGYPSAILQFARHVRNERTELRSLKGVIVTAETLLPDVREEIEASLGVPLLNYYAASEGVPLIQECVHGNLHMRLESGIFEILDAQGGPVGPGEQGELVVTSFVQWKTPLIRYRTGDHVRACKPETACPCGRTLPLVGEILGRVEDLVVTRDGRQLGMFSYRTLKYVHGLAEAQIIQRTPVDFLVRYIASSKDDESERIRAEITNVFTRALGYQPSVSLERVEELERGPGGKLRAVVRAF